jgi:arabinofuranosyltransferase
VAHPQLQHRRALLGHHAGADVHHRSDRVRARSTALSALPVAALLLLGWHRRWMSDDGFINVRVVDNVFRGHGPVFNPGERVEVGTSTLWLAVLAIGHALAPFTEISVVAVYAGLLASAAGLGLASWGAWQIARRDALVLPLGALVVAALPPFWDFATSGLETGLSFLWLGGCFALLARRWARLPADGLPPAYRAPWAAFVIGLGPLVRPDLALLAAALAVALLLQSRRSVRSWAGAAAVALAVPVAYEVFRAGYYGTLVPNTALAKNAGTSLWAVGRTYAGDYAGTYLLVVPLAALVLLVWGPAVVRSRGLPLTALLVAPVAGAVLHALFVVRVGGDFMHARFLLPATFAACMPVAVVAVPRAARLVPGVAVAVVLVWAVVAGTSLRPDYLGGKSAAGIADERGVYVGLAHVANPVRIEDYAAHSWYQRGRQVRAEARRGQHAYVDLDLGRAPAAAHEYVLRFPNLGILGVAAGPDVLVADSLSLADPVGARLVLPPAEHARVGHSQVVPPVWHRARYAAAEPTDGRGVRAARRSLGCGRLRELLDATGGPLTLRRFLRNLVHAPARTALRVPVRPVEAQQALCR